jgi:ketosteroid isomerase-like protein
MANARGDGKEQELIRFGDHWASAELHGDAAALDAMATDDFMLVGPLGYVLSKEQWLQRYQAGDLVNTSFTWSDIHLRIHGPVAIAIGVQTQESSYRGQPSVGRFRVTQVLLNESRGWKLASIHLSPIAQGA